MASAAKEKAKKEKKAEKAEKLSKAPLKAKKEKDQPLTRKERIELLKDRINNSYAGSGAIVSGDDFSNIFTLRRPTGIIDLDIAIGGGFPAGGLSQVIGEENAGKSYLANCTVARVQETYGDDAAISVCMTEQKYDKAFSKWKCGVAIAMSKMEIQMLEQARVKDGLPPFNDQELAWLRHQIGHFQESIFATGEQLLEAAVQQVEENVFQIVIIDSFGAIITAAEAEAEDGLEAQFYGGASKVITNFMHRLHAALNLPDQYGRPNTTTVIGINQYRENLKAKTQYDNPLQIAGGRALKHGKLVDVFLRKGAKIRVGPKDNQVVVGKEINWNIIKGKAGCHDGGTGDYRFYYGENGYGFGADVYHNLLMTGVRLGVVDKSGAWYSFQGTAICQGQDGAAEVFMKSPALMEAIRQACFAAAKLSFITKETF